MTSHNIAHSEGDSQKNGLLLAICLNLAKQSVNVALNNNVCLSVDKESNITVKSFSKQGSNKRSASSKTCRKSLRQ